MINVIYFAEINLIFAIIYVWFVLMNSRFFIVFLHVIKACQPNRLMSPTNTLYPRKDKKARGVHHLYGWQRFMLLLND